MGFRCDKIQYLQGGLIRGEVEVCPINEANDAENLYQSNRSWNVLHMIGVRMIDMPVTTSGQSAETARSV